MNTKEAARASARSLVLALTMGLLLPSFGGAVALENVNLAGASGAVGSVAAAAARAVAPAALSILPSGAMISAPAPVALQVQAFAAPAPLSAAPLAARAGAPAPAVERKGASPLVEADRITALHAIATVESLPKGAVRDDMMSLAHALADRAGAGVFDGSNGSEASDEDASEQGAESSEAQATAAALHKKYEKVAAGRIAAFQKAVEKIKSGRFGLSFQITPTEQGFRYVKDYTVGKDVLTEEEIEAKVAAGEFPAAEWKKAKTELKAAEEKLVAVLTAVFQLNEKEHQAVHQQMSELVKGAALKSVRETLAKGADLQSWGLPISISVDQKTAMRYAHLYRLSGMPTDLGIALHDLIAPLIAADPKFLSRVTQAQLHESVQYLKDSLNYSLDENTPDGRKRMRSSEYDAGYSYPEVQKSLVDLARRKLTETPQAGDKSANLGAVAPESQTSAVVMKIFQEAATEYKAKAEAGQEDSKLQELLMALHAAIGLPIKTSQGAAMIPVQHRQLLPIVAALRERQASDDVVKAVIRSFPLGESLVRLGVDGLWAQGITGKGVKVAVIDNGIDFDHPDFSTIENPISENMTRDRGVHTKGGHATPMASIIHAIAPDAEIQSYQALSNTQGLPGVSLSPEETDNAILKALDRAKANGAQIISMSIGAPMGYGNDSVAKKIAEFAKEGIVVVASAGNEGYEYPKGYQVGTPATAPDAIAVGAVNYHGEVRGSNEAFGSEGPVFNPADNTVAEKPEIWAYGVNVKAAQQGPAALYAQEPVPYRYGSGTSPAAPHVSGVSALMLQAAKEAGQKLAKASITGRIRQALIDSAERIDRHAVLTNAVAAVEAFLAPKR